MVKLIQFNDKYYQLIRSIKVSQVNNNMEGLKAWMERLHCNHVLKHDGHYLVVRTVDDVEIIEK